MMHTADAVGPVLFLTVAVAVSFGQAQELPRVTTPDGRVDVGVSVDPPDDGYGGLRTSGNVGAYGFDSGLEGDASGGRIVNPPFNHEVGTDGQTYQELYGPPIANATIGTGGITTGYDAWGRLTNLGWPGPGLYEHVDFVHVTRGWPNKGAPENAGSFGGMVVETPNGPVASWIHPSRGWLPVGDQHYASNDAQTVVTTLRNEALDVEVVITDVVDPVEDLVARNFRFRRGDDPFTPSSFAHYANMNPTTSRAPRVPSVFDGLVDNVSDFATAYDEATSAMLHFRPYRIDPAAVTRLATSQPASEVAFSAVEGTFGPGVYVAIAGHAAAGDFQAGVEAGGLVRDEAEGTPLLDPYDDFLGDGALSGSLAAVGKTAGALAGIAPDPDGSYTVYVTAAESASGALAAIEAARARGFTAIRSAAESWWANWLADARLPAAVDAPTLAVAKRALMLIRTAQDRETGAILANVTAQTPYRQDWVRDGAFFNYALLLAGKNDMVLHHNAFYRRIYRPGGTWDSFYFADGAEASAVFVYEIDSQAFALWALWLPYELGAAGHSYLEESWSAIRDTANAILLCSDPTNGLQCTASEDDNPVPTQGAQGAATVYLALRAAAAAADELGHASDRDRWNARAGELRQATLERLCGGGNCPGGRGGVHLAWPSRLVDADDPDTASLAQTHLAKYVSVLDARSNPDPNARFPKPPGAFQYPMESILALAPLWLDPDRQTRLESWIEWLTHEVAEPGVLHYGERIFRCAGGGPFCGPGGDPALAGREYLHGVGFPHIWSGTEVYIAAAFVHGLTGCPDGTTSIGEATCTP